MLTTAKIKIRDLKELQGDGDFIKLQNKDLLSKTSPLRKRKNPRKAATTSKKTIRGTTAECDTKSRTSDKSVTQPKKILPKTAKKFVQQEQPPTQKRISSYFSASEKTYRIKCDLVKAIDINVGSKLESCGGRETDRRDNNNSQQKFTKNSKRSKAKRRRLFADGKKEETDVVSNTISGLNILEESQIEMPVVDCIIEILDDDDEEVQNIVESTKFQISEDKDNKAVENKRRNLSSTSCSSMKSSKTSDENAKTTNTTATSSSSRTAETNKTLTFSRRKLKPCPPYKIIEDTTFAVDAFQFGYIENVTHYFLTHFHADHYIGLTKSFAKPIYMSPITARFLRAFIPIEEQYIHELNLNETYTINGIEVTALDANHCPGAILLVFKLPKSNGNNDTEKCILHTGDFRAWHGMESEPIFWNNDIHTIYLDTTYISDKYAFCSQDESLLKAHTLIENFREKHANQRILYICGCYVIGKEKFWSKLAEEFQLKVWAEGNRYKALKALNDEQINTLLVDQATEANMHIIAMGKLSYLNLLEYFKEFEGMYDLVFAIRPSGWEKDAKPQYRGKINIIGIEYSEHSSYSEMKRFVKYLKPQKVLSTVPCGRDLMRTSEIPLSWYKYDKLKSSSNYQPTIATYFGQTDQNKTIRPPNQQMDGMEKFVSPLKCTKTSVNSTVIETSEEQNTSTNNLSKSSKAKTKDTNKLQAEPNENTNRTSNTNASTPKDLTNNSSEEFESADTQVKRKSPRHSKRQLKEKETNTETIKVEEKNKKTLRKRLKELQTSPQETAAASQKSIKREKKMPTTSTKLKSTPKLSNQTLLKSPAKLSQNSDTLEELATIKRMKRNSNKKQLKNIKIHYLSSEEFESDTPVARTIRTEALEIDEIPAIQRIHENSTSKVVASSKNSQSLKTETPACDEIPYSQRLYETKASKSRSQASSSTSSQNLKDLEFEAQLENITKENEKKLPRAKPQQVIALKNSISLENPLFKSTSTSVASTSTDEILPSQLCLDRILRNKSKKTLQKHSSDSIDQRLNIKEDSTNFPQTLTTNIFVKTLLHNTEALEKFSCTQLAGAVMSAINEKNPDVSKDHIPADLLSSTEDDDSVLKHQNHKIKTELSWSLQAKHKRQSFSSDDQCTTPSDMLKLSIKDEKSILNYENHSQLQTIENIKAELPCSSLSGRKRSWASQSSMSLKKSKQTFDIKMLDHKDLTHETELPSASLNGLNRQSSLSAKAQTSTPLKNSKQSVTIVNDRNSTELPSKSSLRTHNRKSSMGSAGQSLTPLKKSKQLSENQAFQVTNDKSTVDVNKFNPETELPSCSSFSAHKRKSSLSSTGQSSTSLKKSKQSSKNQMLPLANDKSTLDVNKFIPENELPSCSSLSAYYRKSSLNFTAQSLTPLKKSKQPSENPIFPKTNDESIVNVKHFNHQTDLPSRALLSPPNRKSSLSSTAKTPLKKSTQYIDTQAVLKTILNTKDDLDKYNPSQLAELVVETINEHNPDHSTDHIPADLLSDADDDWM